MLETLEKLNGCFDRLQNLQIKPTLGNMELLIQTLYDLRDIYKKISESEGQKDGTEGRTTADPE